MENLKSDISDTLEHCPHREICAARIAAESDARVHDKMLTISGIAFILCIAAHIGFAVADKPFNMPEILWAAILAPWLGSGASRLIRLVDKSGEKKS